MTAESPMLVIAALIAEAGGEGLHACMQCGTCTGVCPWPTVEQFSPRLILRQASLGLEGWEEEQVWRCVTCRACEDRCPRGSRSRRSCARPVRSSRNRAVRRVG